jgi:integrase
MRERTAERAIVRLAIDGYFVEMKRRRIVRAEAVATILRRGFEQVLNMEVSALDRRIVVGLIERIATTEKRRKNGTVYTTPGAAMDFRASARVFLEWAVQHGVVQYNVLAGLRLPKLSREEVLAREERQGRALDDPEIVKVWTAAEDAGAFGALVRMALLSGLRRNELSGLRWVDVRDDRIVIPARRSKMGREHSVPLTPLMKTVLASSPRAAGPFVFPSLRTGGKLLGWSGLMARFVTSSRVRFRLHDLRRSTRTLMSRSQIDETTAELAIGHVRKGVIGTYNKDDAWPSRVAAFENVSAHVAAVLAPEPDENVIKIPADRRLAL